MTNQKTATAKKVEDQNIVTPVAETPAAPAQRGLAKTVCKPTAEELTHLATLTTTSSRVRYLAGQGYSTKENLYSGIANYLGVRTQHVRNVLTQPLKKD